MAFIDCNADLLQRWSDSTLQEVMEYWQEKLRLTNWDITIRFARYYEMEEHVYGTNEFDTASMLSQIVIRHPLDHNVADPFGKRHKEDIEFTIIHELLHLTTAEWAALRDSGVADGFAIELCINNLTRTLVSLHRCVPLTTTEVVKEEEDVEVS